MSFTYHFNNQALRLKLEHKLHCKTCNRVGWDFEEGRPCSDCMGYGVEINRRLKLTDEDVIRISGYAERYPEKAKNLKPTTSVDDAMLLAEWTCGFWGAIRIDGNLDNMGVCPSWIVRLAGGWFTHTVACGWTLCEALCRAIYFMDKAQDRALENVSWGTLEDLDDLVPREDEGEERS